MGPLGVAFVGNLLGFAFGGAWLGLPWVGAGLPCFCAIIGMPLGIACFNIVQAGFAPLGKMVVASAQRD